MIAPGHAVVQMNAAAPPCVLQIYKVAVMTDPPVISQKENVRRIQIVWTALSLHKYAVAGVVQRSIAILVPAAAGSLMVAGRKRRVLIPGIPVTSTRIARSAIYPLPVPGCAGTILPVARIWVLITQNFALVLMGEAMRADVVRPPTAIAPGMGLLVRVRRQPVVQPRPSAIVHCR